MKQCGINYYSIYKDRSYKWRWFEKKIENNNKEQKLYKLSEIVFSFNSKEEIEKFFKILKLVLLKLDLMRQYLFIVFQIQKIKTDQLIGWTKMLYLKKLVKN